jgi:hypothetical protein
MFTHHAQIRMQSRSIPYEAVDALLAFGQPRRHCRGDLYCLDKRARSRLSSALGKESYPHRSAGYCAWQPRGGLVVSRRPVSIVQ